MFIISKYNRFSVLTSFHLPDIQCSNNNSLSNTNFAEYLNRSITDYSVNKERI